MDDMALTQTATHNFTEYGKIDTLFERDDKTFVVDPSRLRHPVYQTINQWDVTEKIDGTNIRVILSADGDVRFGGRTANAQLPADLLYYLIQQCPPEKLCPVFNLDGPTEAILFGEGYGAGIQKGGSYRPDKSFVLFDVLVGGKWWLDKNAVDDVATKLGIDTVPYLGRMTLSEIVELVRVPFPSKIGSAMAEGVVARPIEPLFDRKGARVILKLKTKDFTPGKR